MFLYFLRFSYQTQWYLGSCNLQYNLSTFDNIGHICSVIPKIHQLIFLIHKKTEVVINVVYRETFQLLNSSSFTEKMMLFLAIAGELLLNSDH